MSRILRKTVDLFRAVDRDESYNEDSLRYSFAVLLLSEVIYAILFLFEEVSCAPFLVPPHGDPGHTTVNASLAANFGDPAIRNYVNAQCSHELKLYLQLVLWMAFSVLVLASFLLTTDRSYVVDLNAAVENQPLEEGIEQRKADYEIQKLVRRYFVFKVISLVLYLAMISALWAITIRELNRKNVNQGMNFVCGGDASYPWQENFPLYGGSEGIHHYACSLIHGTALITLSRFNDVLRVLLILRFVGAIISLWSYRRNAKWREYRVRKLAEIAREQSAMMGRPSLANQEDDDVMTIKSTTMVNGTDSEKAAEILELARKTSQQNLHRRKQGRKDNLITEMANIARKSISGMAPPVRRGRGDTLSNLVGGHRSRVGESDTLDTETLRSAVRAGIGSVIHSLRTLEDHAPGSVIQWLQSDKGSREEHRVSALMQRGSQIAIQTYNAISGRGHSEPATEDVSQLSDVPSEVTGGQRSRGASQDIDVTNTRDANDGKKPPTGRMQVVVNEAPPSSEKDSLATNEHMPV